MHGVTAFEREAGLGPGEDGAFEVENICVPNACRRRAIWALR